MASRSDEPDFTVRDPRHSAGSSIRGLPRAYLEAYAELLRSSLPHAVYVCDARTGRVEYLNTFNSFDLGYTPEEMASFGNPPVAIMHPDDVRKIPETLARFVLEPEVEIYTTEVRLRARDGTWHTFRTCDMVLERSSQGDVISIMGTSHDVTGLDVATPQRANARRVEAMGRVAGWIAHDFGAALATLGERIGATRAALWDPDEATRALQDAEDALAEAARLNHRLTGFAEQQGGRPETLSLCELLTEASPLLRSLFSHRLLHLDLRPTPAIRARRNRLLEVVVQLAGNASPDTAALVIHCSAGSPPARRGLDGDATEDRWAVLRIEEHLKAPPAEADGRAPRPPSTPLLGLGLDTARELIGDMGAVLEVTHLDLRACKLELRFPPARQAATPHEVASRGPLERAATPESSASRLVGAHSSASARPRSDARPPGRVLIVEDDAVLLELTHRMVSRAGYDAVTADSGEAALTLWKLDPESVLLVITDVVMPGMSGLELAMRMMRDRPAVPVIFASGFLQDALTRHSLQLDRPNVAFCDKPFRAEDLLGTVARLVIGA
jgi:two-component system cell cycle sensor histidine kinase/response regulator CckA